MKSLTFEHSLSGGRILEIQQSPLADGGFVRTYKDITERRRTEVRFQTMAANLPGAIFQAQILPEGRLKFIYVSPGSSEHFDLSPEDLVSGAQRIEIHPEDRERFLESLKTAFKDGQDLEFVGKLKSDGKEKKMDSHRGQVFPRQGRRTYLQRSSFGYHPPQTGRNGISGQRT